MDTLAEKHPLEIQDYTIPTQAIEVMANTISQWIDILIPGGFIYGHPRAGKTSAIEYIIPEIPNILNSNIPTYLYICSEKLTASEGRFYEELLNMVQHALSSNGKIEQKKQRFLNFLVEAAREQNEFRVIIFIDEAQQLKTTHYNWLADIHNQLRNRKIKLTVILVGQYQLLGTKQSFKNSGERQILSRFMACSHRFSGLRDFKELKRFFIGYDKQSEFPMGSGITYTQYYIPKAYEAGWRLVDQAELIWQSLNEVLSSNEVTIRELPMQPLATLTYQLLKELSDIDDAKLEPLGKDMIKELIEYSCLSDLINYCSAPDSVTV